MSSSSKQIDKYKIPLKEIVEATRNFENLIGEGGFGKVYKGNLLWSNKRIDIAARRLHGDYGQGDFEFWNEISMLGLSNLKHDNLVSFVGYCDEDGQKIIITEYEAKQSLDVHLKDSNLTWLQRLQICVGIARALSYIHYDEGHHLSVIHRNIKSSKVLLDDNWKPKLSGFGISLKNSQARRHRYLLAEVIGTIGYIDPTYEKTGFVTHKSDIFSLGVLLFEVLCGRKAFRPDEQEQRSPQFFKYDYKEGKLADFAVKLDGIAHPHSYTNEKMRPASFDGTQPPSFFVVKKQKSVSGGKNQSTSFVGRQPSSFNASRSASFVGRPRRSNTGSSQSALDYQRNNLLSMDYKLRDGPPSFSKFDIDDIREKSSNSKAVSIGPLARADLVDSPSTVTAPSPEKASTPSPVNLQNASPANEPTAAYVESLAMVTTTSPVNVPTTIGPLDRPGSSSISIGIINKSMPTGNISITRELTESPAKEPTPAYVVTQLPATVQTPSLLNLSIPSPANEITPGNIVATPSPADHQLSVYDDSSMDNEFTLHPLYTMKKLEHYIHSPNQELLAQSVKYHYNVIEDNLDLDDMIDQALKKQMDPESFKIFSKTAFSCLKEQRSQRPNIDLIFNKLEIALAHQIKHENPEQSQIPVEVEGTLSSSKRLERGDLDHLKIPLSEIETATKKYLGSGTYGKVYRADLKFPLEENDQGEIAKKRTVAIKCITDSKHGKEGFIAEIELLTSCKHPNIVSLLGFCDEGPNLILVYEYASNKSLDNYLGGSTINSINLTWIQRLKICIDIARGLNYLHTRDEDEHKIVHRDLKSGNILLGDNLVAKIADFGLSRFNRVDEEGKTFYTGTIAGTPEYMCPKYKMSGRLKKEIDIYSLGVVLLEILSGKLAYDDIFIEENETGIAHVARRRLKEGTINDMVDQKIMEEVDELTSTLNKGPNQDSLKTFIEIARKCIEEHQDKRPRAKEVMEELQKALLLQEKNKDNLRMSFADVESATENFSSKNLIGEGGFGPVYKGKLGINIIAAKRLKKRHGQGEHHFLTELEILFDYKHENIICLEGYCNEKDEKIIVYEYAPEGSLDQHLKKNSLTWIKRLQICIDVACGLAYIHGGAQTNEIVIHRDIKCANILLTGEWKAKISDFGLSSITTTNQEDISDCVGTNGYLDPKFGKTGFFTEKSDIYSFGVVLFEILYGKLVAPNTKNYDQKLVDNILKDIHQDENLRFIVFLDIKRQIAPESLSTFREIVSKCLQYERASRPTAEEVLQQLTKAMEFQEEYEIWQPKLPKDYEKIIQMSKSPEVYSIKSNKDLYNIFSNGILLPKDKVWFSLGNNGERNEMISAKKFSYKNRRLQLWRSVPESRFQKVAKLLDISNLKIQILVKTQFLSQDVTYGVHLVFKFCDRPISSKPMYVNLTYKMESNILHSYFATSRNDNWMMIELCRFLNNKEHNDFSALLESLSRYYCGSDAIYVEGIEFRAMDKVKNDKPEEVQSVLESDSMNNVQKLPIDCDDIIKRSSQSVRNSSKEELYSLLINWILIDNDEKLFSLSKRNGKKCHMLPAKAVLCDSSNVMFFALRDSFLSRFDTEVELLSPPQFRIQCKIESRLLSSDTKYRCYLVYKISEKCRGLHYPVRVRDQRHRKNKVVGILYFRSPSLINVHDTFRVPEERKDGWMEVKVWEFRTDIEQKDSHVPMDLKLISYEGNLKGLILYGLEFRPM